MHVLIKICSFRNCIFKFSNQKFEKNLLIINMLLKILNKLNHYVIFDILYFNYKKKKDIIDVKIKI